MNQTNIVSAVSTQEVNAPADKIWAQLADNFLNVSDWAGGVNTSVANPATPTGFNGSPHGGRICDVDGMGVTDERVVGYDATNKMISYTISSRKIPFFVETMTSTWTVVALSQTQSSLTLTVTAKTKGLIGRLAAKPLSKMVNGAAPGLLGDLKTYMQTELR
jgi:hypothetical protein